MFILTSHVAHVCVQRVDLHRAGKSQLVDGEDYLAHVFAALAIYEHQT